MYLCFDMKVNIEIFIQERFYKYKKALLSLESCSSRYIEVLLYLTRNKVFKNNSIYLL